MTHSRPDSYRPRPWQRSLLLACGLALTLGSGFGGQAGKASGEAPTSIRLPVGFQPEGTDTGLIDGHRYLYTGSMADGSIYRADLDTGEGSVFSPRAPSPSIGIELDRRGRLFVASGVGGVVNGDAGAGARVIDARTGDVLATYKFGKGATLVNDVTVMGNAVWFTDTINPVLYKLPLGPNGELPPADGFQTLPITGAYHFDDKASTVDGNGITPTPDGRALIVIQYRTGKLFHLDPATGMTRLVNVGGATFPQGDGLTLDGTRLYVPQNTNKVAVIKLNTTGTAGRLIERVTSPSFNGPTNVARSGNRLWVVSARFNVTSPKTTPYTVSSIRVP